MRRQNLTPAQRIVRLAQLDAGLHRTEASLRDWLEAFNRKACSTPLVTGVHQARQKVASIGQNRGLGGYIWPIRRRQCGKTYRIPPIPAKQTQVSLCFGSSETTHQTRIHIDEQLVLDAALARAEEQSGLKRRL